MKVSDARAAELAKLTAPVLDKHTPFHRLVSIALDDVPDLLADRAAMLDALRRAAERERIMLYWIARAWVSGHREGWEPGPSVNETMAALHDILANMDADPTTPAGEELLRETHSVVPPENNLRALLASSGERP